MGGEICTTIFARARHTTLCHETHKVFCMDRELLFVAVSIALLCWRRRGQVIAAPSSSDDDMDYTVYGNGGSSDIGFKGQTAASSVPAGPLRVYRPEDTDDVLAIEDLDSDTSSSWSEEEDDGDSEQQQVEHSDEDADASSDSGGGSDQEDVDEDVDEEAEMMEENVLDAGVDKRKLRRDQDRRMVSGFTPACFLGLRIPVCVMSQRLLRTYVRGSC